MEQEVWRMITESCKCRVCGSYDLHSVINLGEQVLASVFPKDKTEKILKAPLELVKCNGECGLLQLRHTLDRDLMYGEGYGYKSGVNKTMQNHLSEIVEYAMDMVSLEADDVIIDIGSNDGTLLSKYPDDIESIGIDPSGEKFRHLYPKHSTLHTEYFDKLLLSKTKRAKIITSIAMFYDLQDPLEFMNDIKSCLAFDGIWITEMAYLPSMLNNNSFDTICHEHLEYYGMTQIKWMADKVGLDVIDVVLTDINGGSFMVTLAHPNTNIPTNYRSVNYLINKEMEDGLDTMIPYKKFQKNIESIAKQLKTVIKGINDQGEVVLGYGASTKGNVILQYAGITKEELPHIADRNPEKFNCFTPTGIPIISEEAARWIKPNYFLVLPWHFKEEILNREKAFIDGGGKFIFPLPTIRILPSTDYREEKK